MLARVCTDKLTDAWWRCCSWLWAESTCTVVGFYFDFLFTVCSSFSQTKQSWLLPQTRKQKRNKSTLNIREFTSKKFQMREKKLHNKKNQSTDLSFCANSCMCSSFGWISVSACLREESQLAWRQMEGPQREQFRNTDGKKENCLGLFRNGLWHRAKHPDLTS